MAVSSADLDLQSSYCMTTTIRLGMDTVNDVEREMAAIAIVHLRVGEKMTRTIDKKAGSQLRLEVYVVHRHM